MATQETTIETQPIEKENQPVDDEIISLEIRENIRLALQSYLNAHGMKYSVVSYTDSQDAETDGNNRMGRLVLANDTQERVVPDPYYNNEHMMYTIRQQHIYTLWVSTSDDDKRYLYAWMYEGRFYVIAPYFVPPEGNRDIFCSFRLEVTQAVYSVDPISSMRVDLEQLANRSNSQTGFKQDMYRWDTDGGDDNFTICKPDSRGTWYWKVRGERTRGHMALDTNEAVKARLQLTHFS